LKKFFEEAFARKKLATHVNLNPNVLCAHQSHRYIALPFFVASLALAPRTFAFLLLDHKNNIRKDK
jgi:hypothetical protein